MDSTMDSAMDSTMNLTIGCAGIDQLHPDHQQVVCDELIRIGVPIYDNMFFVMCLDNDIIISFIAYTAYETYDADLMAICTIPAFWGCGYEDLLMDRLETCMTVWVTPYLSPGASNYIYRRYN